LNQDKHNLVFIKTPTDCLELKKSNKKPFRWMSRKNMKKALSRYLSGFQFRQFFYCLAFCNFEPIKMLLDPSWESFYSAHSIFGICALDTQSVTMTQSPFKIMPKATKTPQ